ncbi:MAG: hypothetical protein AB7K04_10865 [Pseudorhodoplanes sp.]
MRQLTLLALAILLSGVPGGPAGAQITPVPAAPPAAAPIPTTPDGDIRIVWEVKNRFRLFRNEADFQRQVAAFRDDGVLGAEMRLARASNGRGWARDVVDRTCIDQSGKLPETCQRDNERENYLSPQDHRIGVVLAGSVAAGATCNWSFADDEGAPRTVNVPCEEEVKLRVRYRKVTTASVEMHAPDGATQQATTEIAVRDVLIAGMGDSVAAGEGNPDRPVALDDGGFCFRRFFGGTLSEYFRPGRAGFRGNKACDPGTGATGGTNSSAEWARYNAAWFSSACHRSLYSYQTRTALALAIQNPHLAVTYLPLACSGASIDLGVFNAQRARECPSSGSCATTAPAQLPRLQEALALARKRDPARTLDLVLLTVGANDIYFSGLVAHAIVQSGTERTLFQNGGMITTVPESQKLLDREFPAAFQKLRAALKPIVGGNLARVVFVSYGHPSLQADGTSCPGGPAGFDVHPAFNMDAERLRVISTYVSEKFLPRIKALALCEGGTICNDPDTERMTFVDSHQAAFQRHGLCATSENDPVFDRECFSASGESFESNPAEAATGPLVCAHRPRDFRPYASRARWIRTANDSYFTAMTYPIGPSAGLAPSDIHDATWGAMSAVYGGAVHPTAEGHAAMADAALPAVRAVLGLSHSETVRAEPLPPPATAN